jgi:hypothetical protein
LLPFTPKQSKMDAIGFIPSNRLESREMFVPLVRKLTRSGTGSDGTRTMVIMVPGVSS